MYKILREIAPDTRYLLISMRFEFEAEYTKCGHYTHNVEQPSWLQARELEPMRPAAQKTGDALFPTRLLHGDS
jgi:hypothetical protein